MVTIAERVAKGAALLDEREPGWWQRIDLSKLDGQLWTDLAIEDDEEDPYNMALRDLSLYHGKDEDLGFDREDGEQYPQLTAAWRELIEARRSA
jgi:hypothetical protein